MATVALEIHDAGIRAKREGDDRASRESPGFALVEDGRLLTGADAWAACRLRPRHVDSRFWGDLDTTPLASPFSAEVSRADLAHAHLRDYWSEFGTAVEQAILVVPGSYDDRQLGLLLGIAEACQVPVAGLVDAALSSCPPESGDAPLLHLDLQLHATVITELVPGAELSRRDVKLAPGVGTVAFYDAWMRRIAERFVRQTRFDPLHVASSEQALHDALPGLLDLLLKRERTELELEAAGKKHTVELSRDELIAPVSEMLETVARVVGSMARSGRTVRLLLSHRTAKIPGFHRRLSAIDGIEAIRLGADASLDGALRHQHAIRSDGDGFRFVTRLPRVTAAAAPALEPPAETASGAGPRRTGELPTHLLHGDRAYPIDTRPLILGVAVQPRRHIVLTGETAGISRIHCSLAIDGGRVVLEDRSRHGTFLNERRVDGRADLIAGDRLRLGSPGIELRLIRVETDHETP